MANDAMTNDSEANDAQLMTKMLWFFLLLPMICPAQDSLKTAPDPGSFVRLDVENDLFRFYAPLIDQYYTAGLRISHAGRIWAKFPTNRLLLRFGHRADRRFARLYDFTVGQEIYTPIIKFTPAPSVSPPDWPYAGYLFLRWGLTTTDPARGRRLTSSLTLGVIGPMSLAAESQAVIHRWVDEPYPQGWATQLRNDPVVSYAVLYEHWIVPRFSDYADVVGQVDGQVGSLGNQAGIGGQLRLGRFAHYFDHPAGCYARTDPRFRRRLQLYALFGGRIRGLLDNSILQGGWFSASHNPYALSATLVNYVYQQAELGFGLVYRGCRLTYTQTFRTPEFIGGLKHQWGSIGLVFGY